MRKIGLTFKYEEEQNGEACGPVWAWYEDTDEDELFKDYGWMYLSEAKALAEREGFSFYED